MAGDTGSIPGRGSKIPHAAQCRKMPKKKVEKYQKVEGKKCVCVCVCVCVCM